MRWFNIILAIICIIGLFTLPEVSLLVLVMFAFMEVNWKMVFFKINQIPKKIEEMEEKNYNDNVRKLKKLLSEKDVLFSQEPEVQKLKQEYNYDDYLKYITTQQWWENKKNRYIFDNGICQQCETVLTMSNSVCHHLHYRTLFNENMADLVTLCPECHGKIHIHHGKNARNYPLLKK